MIFGSLNINGGASQLCKLQVVNLTLQRKQDVLFLQETHTTPSSRVEWNPMIKTISFFRDSNPRPAGVDFLLKPLFHPSDLSLQNIIPGHLTSLKFTTDNINFTSLNVYTPSKQDGPTTLLHQVRALYEGNVFTKVCYHGGSF